MACHFRSSSRDDVGPGEGIASLEVAGENIRDLAVGEDREAQALVGVGPAVAYMVCILLYSLVMTDFIEASSRPTREMAVLITGASGCVLPARLIPLLIRTGQLDRLHLVMSESAALVASSELGHEYSTPDGFLHALDLSPEELCRTTFWKNSDLSAPIASGSYLLEGVVVLPCSSGTAGALANGISRGLIQRVGDVALKQRWPLILAIRETPMSPILLENLLKLSRAGAIIMPPVPAFYLGPEISRSLDGVISAFCIRVLDMLGIHPKTPELRWGS